jgi:hypothetical protein
VSSRPWPESSKFSGSRLHRAITNIRRQRARGVENLAARPGAIWTRRAARCGRSTPSCCPGEEDAEKARPATADSRDRMTRRRGSSEISVEDHEVAADPPRWEARRAHAFLPAEKPEACARESAIALSVALASSTAELEVMVVEEVVEEVVVDVGVCVCVEQVAPGIDVRESTRYRIA